MDAKQYAVYNIDEVECKHPEEFIRIADDNTGAYCRKCCKWISVTEVAVSAELAALRAENARLREALEEISKRSWCSECSSADIARAALRGEQ